MALSTDRVIGTGRWPWPRASKPLAIGRPPAIVMTSPHTLPPLKKLMSKALRHSGGPEAALTCLAIYFCVAFVSSL